MGQSGGLTGADVGGKSADVGHSGSLRGGRITGGSANVGQSGGLTGADVRENLLMLDIQADCAAAG